MEPEAGAEGDAETVGGCSAAAVDGGPLTAEPVNRDDAWLGVIGAARYLRRIEPANPAAYLMLRGLRWGEVRAVQRANSEPRLLQAPTTQLRSQLKSLLLDGKWPALLEALRDRHGAGVRARMARSAALRDRGRSRLGQGLLAVETALRDALRGVSGRRAGNRGDDDDGRHSHRQRRNPAVDRRGDAGRETPIRQPRAGSRAPNADAGSRRSAGWPAPAAPKRRSEMLKPPARSRNAACAGGSAAARNWPRSWWKPGRTSIAQPILEDLVAPDRQLQAGGVGERRDGRRAAGAAVPRAAEARRRSRTRQADLYLRICRLDPIQALKCPQ